MQQPLTSKETMNLKDNKEGYVEGLGGRKGKGGMI